MHRWTHRYFTLVGPKLSYKLRIDSAIFRGDFDLAPGCIVTDITEAYIGTVKGRKIYTFWIVWPHDKHQKPIEESDKNQIVDDESDDEEYQKEKEKEKELKNTEKQKSKLLKEIIENEQSQVKEKQKKAEEQIERHQAHDKFVSAGVKIGAFAVGGILVGVFTG